MIDGYDLIDWHDAPLPPRRRFIAALAIGFVIAAVVGVWRAVA